MYDFLRMEYKNGKYYLVFDCEYSAEKYLNMVKANSDIPNWQLVCFDGYLNAIEITPID